MKHAILALPALLLFAGASVAQTDTATATGTAADATVGAEANASTFGTNWPLSVGTTFFADAESSSLRASEDISTGWASLPQTDRDLIIADCKTFMDAHGADGSAEAGAAAATDTTASTTADTAAATGEATATAATEGTISTAVGYDMAEMKAICEAVGKL